MWYVLYTKPRHEKKLNSVLTSRGYKTYCPLIPVIKQWSDRKKKVFEPIFPSFLFIELNSYETQASLILRDQSAVRFLWWLGKPAVVRDEEIQKIQQFLEEHKNKKIIWNPGDIVSIKKGAFENKSGKVVKIKKTTILLHIESIGWNLIAEIPLEQL